MKKKKMWLRSLLCILMAICLILPLLAYAQEPLGAMTDTGVLMADSAIEKSAEEELPVSEEVSDGQENSGEESDSESRDEAEIEISYTDELPFFSDNPDGTADAELLGAEISAGTESQLIKTDMRFVLAPSVPRVDESDEDMCMVLTGESFENARFSKDSNPTGVFNGKYKSYLLAQSGDLQDRITESTIYIPTDGWYYVGARMRTARTDMAQACYYKNRTMQVSFTQNGKESFVEGSRPWQSECGYDFDSFVSEQSAVYRDINVYLFGAGREFVSDLKSYNYTDAKPVFLRAGEATVTLYGNSYARMDFLVISKEPMADVQTKSEYNSRYKRFENPGQLTFESEPCISSDNELTWPSSFSGCIIRELYLIDGEGNHRLLLRTTADSVDLSNLRFDKSLQLYVKARNMHGSSVTSDPIEFTPTDVYINIGDANIFVDARNKFRTKCAFSEEYPSFKPTRDRLYGDAYSRYGQTQNDYTLLNKPDGVPLKHTTRVFVPKSGTYYVRARVPSYYSDKRHDIKYGTFTLSFEQNGEEKFVQGSNPAENNSDLQSVGKFDSLLSGENNKYLFGAMREFVSDYKGYAYFDAQPIQLEKGYADANIYAYQGAAVDYIVISEHKPLADMTENMFMYSDYCYQRDYHAAFMDTATGVFINGEYSVALPNLNVTGYGLFGVTANGKYENLGYAACGDEKITTGALADSSYRAVALVAYDDTGCYDEQRLPVSDSKVTYVITPDNTFVNDPTDTARFPNSIWRRSISTPEYGDAFNQASNGDIMRTYEAIGHGPKGNDDVYRFALKTTIKIFVPHSGRYKISARTATSSYESSGAPEADRLFCAEVKQNNQVRAVAAFTNSIELSPGRTVDGFGGSVYAFGLSIPYAEPSFRNYDESIPIALSEGEAEISLYGFGNVRLDYIAITDYDVQLPETKEEYDDILYPYEDINLPYLDGEPNIIRNEDGSYEIEAFAKDASGQSITGVYVYECKGDKRTLIGSSDTDSVSCIAEIASNSEICIRAENSIGAYKEYFSNPVGLSTAQELTVSGQEESGCFEYARDSDYFRFTSTIFPAVYNIVSDKMNNFDFRIDVFKVENNSLIKIKQWQYSSEPCRIDSPASAEPTTYLIKVSTGKNVGGYSVGVRQDMGNLERGRFVKKTVNNENVFAYILTKSMSDLSNVVVTVEYDPYQLLLENAVEGVEESAIYPGTYGNIQITESSFGRISFKYLNRFPSDVAEGRILNILKFISQTDGVVNLKYEYTNEQEI